MSLKSPQICCYMIVYVSHHSCLLVQGSLRSIDTGLRPCSLLCPIFTSCVIITSIRTILITSAEKLHRAGWILENHCWYLAKEYWYSSYFLFCLLTYFIPMHGGLVVQVLDLKLNPCSSGWTNPWTGPRIKSDSCQKHFFFGLSVFNYENCGHRMSEKLF